MVATYIILLIDLAIAITAGVMKGYIALFVAPVILCSIFIIYRKHKEHIKGYCPSKQTWIVSVLLLCISFPMLACRLVGYDGVGMSNLIIDIIFNMWITLVVSRGL